MSRQVNKIDFGNITLQICIVFSLFTSIAYAQEIKPIVSVKKGYFSLKGDVTANGKPLSGVKIKLYKFIPGTSGETNYFKTSDSGTYNIPVLVDNFYKGGLYEFSFNKTGFRGCFVEFRALISENVDAKSFVFNIPLELIAAGKNDSVYCVGVLYWSMEKHAFELTWNGRRNTNLGKKDTTAGQFDAAIGKGVIFKNLSFETSKSHILPKSFDELNKLATYLTADLNTTIQINGYTDSTGIEAKNRALSEARAKAVADYLISKGIDKTRISSKGYGSTKPIASNTTEAGREQNRRVEFIIMKK